MKDAHRLGKEKPSDPHSTMQCPGLLVSSTDASGSWVQSPFSERAAPASLSWSCPFLLLQQIPRSSYIQMAPTPLPPHSHVCMGARLCQSCPTLCHSTNYSIPGFPVLHYLPELAKTRVHIIGDAIQPCHPLVPPAPLHHHCAHLFLISWASLFPKIQQC